MEVVLYAKGDQYFGWAGEEEVGDGGAGEGSPQPDVQADVGEAGADVAADRRRRLLAYGGAIRHCEEGNHGDAEGRGVEREGGSDTYSSNQDAAECGPARRSAIGLTKWSRAFAWPSSCAGRTSGTIASNAGPKNAAPAP